MAELLATRELREVALLTPVSRALERRLVGASVQEGAVEDFVRQDELVMTTALGLDTARAQECFVRDVAAAGAAALAFAVRPGRGPIATTVIRAAAACDLPLLQLPWRLPFSQITTLIIARAVEVRASQMLASEIARSAIEQLVIESGSVHGLAGFVEQALGRPVEVIDAQGLCLRSQASEAAWSESSWLNVPVVGGTRVIATLRIAGPQPLDALQTELVRRAALALTDLLGDEAGDEDERSQAVAELFAGLVDARSGSVDHVTRLVRAAGLDVHAPAIAVHLRVAAHEARAPSTNIADMAARLVERVMRARRLPGVQIWHGDHCSLVVQLRSLGHARSAAELLLGGIATAIRGQIPGARVAAGVGRAGTSGDLPRSLREARIAARVAWSTGRRTEHLHYQDLDVDEVLREVVSGAPGALEALQDLCLDGILAYERDRGLPLTSTLVALFGENGNVSSTARRLSINRQSLLYRLERAESLAGLSLSRAGDRLALELAVNAWDAGRLRDASRTGSVN